MFANADGRKLVDCQKIKKLRQQGRNRSVCAQLKAQQREAAARKHNHMDLLNKTWLSPAKPAA
jgi:hypothetical protein